MKIEKHFAYLTLNNSFEETNQTMLLMFNIIDTFSYQKYMRRQFVLIHVQRSKIYLIMETI